MNKELRLIVIMIVAIWGSSCGDVTVRRYDHAPDAPTGVKATAGNELVSVEWDWVQGATSYNIYWKTSPGVTTSDSKFADKLSPYFHTDLTEGTTYYYAVTAENEHGESGLSAEASAKP